MDALWIYFRTILDLKWIFVKMSNAFLSNLFVNEALRLLGRWARWALPAGVVIGLIFPVLADRMQWLVTPSVIGTLTASLLRLDWQRLADFLRRPGLALRIAAIQLVLAPLAVYGLARAGLIPEAFTVITVLQAAASPIGSAAAFAMFIGLSGNLSMAAAVLMTLLLPLTLTGVVSLLLPSYGIDVDVLRFFVRVALTSPRSSAGWRVCRDCSAGTASWPVSTSCSWWYLPSPSWLGSPKPFWLSPTTCWACWPGPGWPPCSGMRRAICCFCVKALKWR
jgi:hypothetical protein